MHTATRVECPYLLELNQHWYDLTTDQQSELARDVDLNYVDDRTTSRDIYADTLHTKFSSVDLIERIGSRWGKLNDKTRDQLTSRARLLAGRNLADELAAQRERDRKRSKLFTTILVRCDKESLERLKLLRGVWDRVIAAQQANIVNAALDVAMSKPPVKNGYRLRVQFTGSSMDRYLALAQHWGNLAPAAQQHAIDTAFDVI